MFLFARVRANTTSRSTANELSAKLNDTPSKPWTLLECISVTRWADIPI